MTHNIHSWLLSGAVWISLSATAAEPLSLDEALDGFESEPELIEDELESLLDGFDEESEALTAEDAPQGDDEHAASIFGSLRGHWVNGASWGFAHTAPTQNRPDYREISRLSSKLWLELEAPLNRGWKLHADGYLRRDFAYQLQGSPQYPQAVLDRYQQDEELGELWLSGSLHPDLDLKLGRQIVVWGQSDYLRVNDTLNPLDMREPGLGEMETLRRPLGMLRGDYYQGPWSITLLAIPEQRPNLTAPCGGEFSATGPRSEVECAALAMGEQFPEDGSAEMEWGLSAMGRFSGWDLSLYGARINHDIPYQDLSSNQLRYARLNQLGAALSIADGSWLWKGELGWFDGLDYTQRKGLSRLDLLAGGEYRGFDEMALSLELLHRRIGGYQSGLSAAPDYLQQQSWQAALAIQQDLYNDTLHLKGVAVRSGSSFNEGGYSRFSAEYELDDHWSATTGGIWYHTAATPPDWGANDRLFFELRQDF
ncbi:MAG: hypothetical protein HOL04_03085 [Gammaproteobacteria bacterium]|jgi:hypothetical protein|nr:hypothetical protein [Gammaproteobacteria bacterium]MBT4605684.1 hypothetical protein [Thiotrichales bacterium]MBT3968462.1 hypothetical protein [Gammaproteobacteria bacterium]MBT4079962.1 hypothetical protein [Gammaproteobacteria bacterium]MBT4328322.1 hypothetical protein [Gammaproteobacteria bacterium]